MNHSAATSVPSDGGQYVTDLVAMSTLLRKAGLTESQAKGYLALVEYGKLAAPDLAEKINESRTNGYAIAEKLAELHLAERKPGPKAVFAALSPVNLRQMVLKKQRELKTTSEELGGILPTLLSQFRLTNNQPGVIYLEGVDSLKLVYDDIIREESHLFIFPSRYDRDDPAVASMIDGQILRQRKANIKTHLLIRPELYADFATQSDKLFEVRPAPIGALDAQIMIFGDHVVLTTFQGGVVNTIVTSPAIAGTLKQLFLALWGDFTENTLPGARGNQAPA